jgi:hypothetical protein
MALRIRAPEFTTFARENRSRRNLHGNEEESKKEETLTVSKDDISYFTTNFTAPYEKHLVRGLVF